MNKIRLTGLGKSLNESGMELRYMSCKTTVIPKLEYSNPLWPSIETGLGNGKKKYRK